MVTSVYLLIAVLLTLLNAGIDMLLYKISLMKALQGLYGMNFGPGRVIMVGQMMIGLAAAVYIDYRRRQKQRSSTSNQEGEQKPPHESTD